MQLDTQDRGFSFQSEAPLDMRFDQGSGMTAADLVNGVQEQELAAVVKRAYRERQRVHPATRTFQALRIAVNDELACLERALPRAVEALKPGGRVAVISFHSLEDRIVKQFFRKQSKDQINPPYMKEFEVERKASLREVYRKPIVPAESEVGMNPRSRSARLRVAEKI